MFARTQEGKRDWGHVIITPLIDVMLLPRVPSCWSFGTVSNGDHWNVDGGFPRRGNPSDLAREPHYCGTSDSSGRIYHDERVMVDGELTAALLREIAGNI